MDIVALLVQGGVADHVALLVYVRTQQRLGIAVLERHVVTPKPRHSLLPSEPSTHFLQTGFLSVDRTKTKLQTAMGIYLSTV